MNIAQILQKAYDTTFKHRFLWWLSLLAIIGGVATESQYQFSFQFPSEIFPESSSTDFAKFGENAYHYIQIYLPIILIVLAIIIIISLLLFIIGLIAKSGQINAILQIDQQQTTNFSQSMSAGKQYAWRIFLIRLIYSIITIASIIISIPILIITFLLFFITIPVLIIYFGALSIIFQNAEIIAIKNNLSTIAAIEQSWHLTTTRWKDYLLLWAIKFGISLVIGICLFFICILFFLASLLCIIFCGIIIYSLQLQFLLPIAILLIVVIFLAISLLFLFISSIFHTFYTSYWIYGTNSILLKK